MQTLYLVDGSNLLFRAYHAMPPMSNSEGIPTGALLGFVNMLLRLEDAYHPTHVGVVFDAGGKSVRAEVYAHYKAHRPACPPEISSQMDDLRILLPLLGYRVLDATHVEADDVIATLTHKASRANMDVVIVSSDKDLMQLCSEHVLLLDTMKNDNVGMLYGPQEVEARFGVSPSQVGDVLALMGDNVDNIPGVPGVGPKTASQLIKQFGSLEALLSRIDDVRMRGADRIKEALRTHTEQIRVAKQLVTLQDQVSVSVSLEELTKQPVRTEPLKQALQKYELRRLFQRFFPTDAWPSHSLKTKGKETSSSAEALPVLAKQPLRLQRAQVVHKHEEWQSWWEHVKRLPHPRLALSLQFAGWAPEPVARTTSVCGIAFAVHSQSEDEIPPLYLPIEHLYLGVGEQWSLSQVSLVLEEMFATSSIPWVFYNAKETYVALTQWGIKHFPHLYADPVLCAYLLDAGQRYPVVSLSERWLEWEGSRPQSREEICQTGKRALSWESIEIERVAQWAGFEVQASLALGIYLRNQLSPEALHLLEEVELPLSRVLSCMELCGVLIQVEVLRHLSQHMGVTLQKLEQEIQSIAGYPINIFSPKQLQELLFEKLQLTPLKKTKTGHSTDAEVLELLASQHPVVQAIQEHRMLAKLKNTYLDQLPPLVDSHTGRLHTRYHQIGAATGRLSSSEPNVQNIPIRGEWGIPIRRAFVAPKGHVLVSADYSQIELRILAHLSKDPILMHSFLAGEDVHQRTAVEMFGPEQGSQASMRRVAKMINYGILYGLTEHGLAARLFIDRKVAKAYIHEYFARYPRVVAYLQELIEKARLEGGAYTLLGRFRPLPELHASSYQTRAYAERMAKNTPLQGTAADLLKLAMVRVFHQLERTPELKTNMILTVHDELVFEVPAAHQQALCALVKEQMEHVYSLSVPLVVDVHAGATWADCK